MRQTKLYAWRNPGMRPPKYVVRRLERAHPTVRLVWNWKVGKWQMVEYQNDGEWGHVAYIEGFPTIENTVGWLNEHDVRRLVNSMEMRLWLESLDHSGDAELKRHEEAAEGKIVEAADRLRHVAGAVKSFVLNPAPRE